MSKSATSDVSMALTLFVIVFLAFIIAPDPTIGAIEYTVDSIECAMKQVHFVWHSWVAAVQTSVLLAANCTIAIAHSINS
jgi:hypothetical protein